MREPSKMHGLAAVFVLLIPAATPVDAVNVHTKLPAAAIHAADLPSPPVIPAFLYNPDVSVAQAGCAPSSHSSRFLEWWRQTWGTGVGHRSRSEIGESDRPTVAFYYLRSPLLSGFYSRHSDTAECAGGGSSARAQDEPGCALVSLRLAQPDRVKRFEVILPQHDARTPRQLESAIHAQIEKGETVVLLRSNGKQYRVAPALIRGLSSGACAGD